MEFEDVNVVEKDRGPWKVFAIVGYVLGIIGLATSWLLVGLEFSVPGIVLSALGKKSTDPEKRAKAEKGLKFSIIATVISTVLCFALVVGICIFAINNGEAFEEILESIANA